MPTIQPFDPSTTAAVEKTIMLAFASDPMLAHVAPDTASRRRVLRIYAGLTLAYGKRYGRVDTTADGSGVAIWFKPGYTEITPWRFLRTGMFSVPFRVGLRPSLRVLDAANTMEAIQKVICPGPHWYLALLGVTPAQQGQGIGSALMQPVLQQADQNGIPCYLETFKQRNVPLYERHGFTVQHTEPLANGGPQFWAMQRD